MHANSCDTSATARPHRNGKPMPKTAAALSVIALTLGLGACSPKPESAPAASPEPTVGQRIDGAVTATKQNADEAQAELKQAATTASNEARQAAADAGDAVADAAITTAVNAKLAADEQLSALRINVDTEGGHVAMVGEAPNESARERATALAQSVRGVQSVDNRLTVKPQS
jgi:hyperosmotically inducible protein